MFRLMEPGRIFMNSGIPAMKSVLEATAFKLGLLHNYNFTLL
jgi:hypothetical protein